MSGGGKSFEPVSADDAAPSHSQLAPGGQFVLNAGGCIWVWTGPDCDKAEPPLKVRRAYALGGAWGVESGGAGGPRGRKGELVYPGPIEPRSRTDPQRAKTAALYEGVVSAIRGAAGLRRGYEPTAKNRVKRIVHYVSCQTRAQVGGQFAAAQGLPVSSLVKAVKARFEPGVFTAHFPDWQVRNMCVYGLLMCAYVHHTMCVCGGGKGKLELELRRSVEGGAPHLVTRGPLPALDRRTTPAAGRARTATAPSTAARARARVRRGG
mgnify:CR=1 FL=1